MCRINMAAQVKEVAAGFIIFRRLQQNIQYLAMQTSYGENHWTPPKGHLEGNETEMEAALRETDEEAGIKKEQLKIHDFKDELRYMVKGNMKRVVYWVAEVADPNTPVIMSHEHRDYKWATLEETRDLYKKYDDMRKLMDRVHEFISSLDS